MLADTITLVVRDSSLFMKRDGDSGFLAIPRQFGLESLIHFSELFH